MSTLNDETLVRRQLLASAHGQWLRNEVTIALIAELERDEKHFVELIAGNSMNEDVSDAKIRRFAAQLLTVRQTLEMIRDSSDFAEAVNK
jgi:hypothetical protein